LLELRGLVHLRERVLNRAEVGALPWIVAGKLQEIDRHQNSPAFFALPNALSPLMPSPATPSRLLMPMLDACASAFPLFIALAAFCWPRPNERFPSVLPWFDARPAAPDAACKP